MANASLFHGCNRLARSFFGIDRNEDVLGCDKVLDRCGEEVCTFFLGIGLSGSSRGKL